MSDRWGARLRRVPGVIAFGYLFFLAIELMGRGMKTSFKAPLKHFLEAHAEQFTELVSFVIGILGTALIQSSSSVTSMSVVLVQEEVMPLVIAAGIVHGANLGTSVTSSVVAFASETRPLTRRPLEDLRILLFAERGEGFSRAVGAAVVHDLFNIVMVTGILLLLELPFGVILSSSTAGADWLATRVGSSAGLLGVLSVVSPATYTRPVSVGLLAVGVPGWALTAMGLPLLFVALKGFSGRMKALVMEGVDLDDLSQVGDTLLGRSALDTFVRGMLVTIAVQSSSATTSMVVPLAAMGLFDVRKVFPFILGANVGTTTTALLAATGRLGQPGFHEGMTVALCHLELNALAVVVAVSVPGLSAAVLRAARVMGAFVARVPALLVGYLAVLCIAVPSAVYVLPEAVSAVVLGSVVAGLLWGPWWWERHQNRP